MSFDKPKTWAGRYVKNVLIAVDQLGNALWGGEADETISSRLGRQKAAAKNGSYRMRPVPRLLYSILGRIDTNHCPDAIEHDENASHGQPAARNDPPRNTERVN